MMSRRLGCASAAREGDEVASPVIEGYVPKTSFPPSP
jgi:hypothetical protein